MLLMSSAGVTSQVSQGNPLYIGDKVCKKGINSVFKIHTDTAKSQELVLFLFFHKEQRLFTLREIEYKQNIFKK